MTTRLDEEEFYALCHEGDFDILWDVVNEALDKENRRARDWQAAAQRKDAEVDRLRQWVVLAEDALHKLGDDACANRLRAALDGEED